MRVTETKTKTTLYDSNGREISVVRQTVLEVVETKPLKRIDCIKVKGRVEKYQTTLEKAKELKVGLEKAKGPKEGSRIFRDMADLLVLFEE